MHQIRSLNVRFDEPITAGELEYFRAAIVEKVGRKHDWYHNHNNGADASHSFHYRYPKIQYYRHQQRPVILFIQEIVGEARHFFMQSDWTLRLKDRTYDARLSEMKAQQQDVGILAKGEKTYFLNNWLALNEENYALYQQTDRLIPRLELLERILVSQIVTLARSLGVTLDQPVSVGIIEWERTRSVHYKKAALLSFDIRFKTNVLLPARFGIGKGSSIGYGRIWPFIDKKNDAVDA